MKRILFTLAGIAALIFAASCQKETGIEAGKNGNVTFTVTLPGIETKAISDGLSATKLDFAIYDGEGNYLQALTESATVSDFSGKKATVTVQVIQDLSYQFVFFAHADGDGIYTFAPADKKLSVAYKAANDDKADCFYAATDVILVTGPLQKSVTLYRPLAQINVGSTASDIAAAELSNIDVDALKSKLTVKDVFNTMDLLTGEASGETDAEFTLAAKPTETLTVNGNDYGWIAMAYVLADAKQVSDVELDAQTNNTATDELIQLHREIANVPVQRNHRTNILGNIFSQTATFNIEIDSDFDARDFNVIIPAWDGVTRTEVTPSGNVYIITNGDELAWVAKATAEGNNFSGKTVKLAADINLGGHEWMPIGSAISGGVAFQGTFDGDGHTVSFFTIDGDESYGPNYLGLIGKAFTSPVIKNVTVTDVEIKNNQKWCGGLLGWGYTNVENCHAKRIKVGSDHPYSYKVGALIGFICEGNYTIKNNSAEDSEVLGSLQVGAIMGCVLYGNITITGNSVNNVTLTRNAYTGWGDDYQGYFGAIFGNGDSRANYTLENNTASNVTFVNCVPGDELYGITD